MSRNPYNLRRDLEWIKFQKSGRRSTAEPEPVPFVWHDDHEHDFDNDNGDCECGATTSADEIRY